jgi:hypothetical protein
MNKTETSLAKKHKEMFDLQTRFRSNKYVLKLSLFSAEYYGNLWITPSILVELMGLFHCVWASSCVCVFTCAGDWGSMMKCLLVLHCDGFPEDISSPTERTLCSWLFYLCSGKGRANPCASVCFIWRVNDGREIHTDDNFLPTNTQNMLLETIKTMHEKIWP